MDITLYTVYVQLMFHVYVELVEKRREHCVVELFIHIVTVYLTYQLKQTNFLQKKKKKTNIFFLQIKRIQTKVEVTINRCGISHPLKSHILIKVTFTSTSF